MRPVTTASPRYWGFISYSHADERVCRWLHRSIERYRVPAHLVGTSPGGVEIPSKLFPVFRDRDELAGAGALGPKLQQALAESQALIVICSPCAARSHWVNEEIKLFKRLGGHDRVLALIVDGEPNAVDKGRPERECFPAALRYEIGEDGELSDVPAEPIAADLRPHGDGRSNAKLKLIAGILGVGFDQLRQRELQARNRRLALLSAVTSGVAAVTVVLAILAMQARNEAQTQQQRAELAQQDAERRQQQAESLIKFMLGDLRDKLEPIGKLDILDAVGSQAIDYFATLEPRDETDAVLASRATALRQIGEVRHKQGDMAGASAAYREALRLDSELVSRHPGNIDYLGNVGESEFSVGYGLYAEGQLDQALPWMERYAATAERLVILAPDRPESVLARVHANMNLGALAVGRGRSEPALEYFQAAAEAQAELLDQDAENLEYLTTLSGIHSWLAYLYGQRRAWGTALDHGLKQVELARKLLALEPDNASHEQDLIKALHYVLYNQARLQPVSVTAPELQEVLRRSAALIALDPENIEYKRAHWVSLARLESAQLWAGELAAAQASNEQAMALSQELLERAPNHATVVDDFLKSHERAVRLLLLRDRPAEAGELVKAVISQFQPASNERIRRSDSWLALHLLRAWLAEQPQRPEQLAKLDELLEFRADSPVAAEVALLMQLLSQEASAHLAYQELDVMEQRHPFVQKVCAESRACTRAQ